MDDKFRGAELPHNVIMENRRKIIVSGVNDVMSFDEGEIVMNTALGVLILHGGELRIEKLSLDSGDVVIEGSVDRLEYEEDNRVSCGLFSRLFK